MGLPFFKMECSVRRSRRISAAEYPFDSRNCSAVFCVSCCCIKYVIVVFMA